MKNSQPEGTKIEFKGERIQVQTKDVEGHRKEMVVHPGAVVILPIMNDGQILLIRNERFAINETLWELPAGTLEKNEAPLKTANRELLEETGYHAKKMEHLISFYTSPGFSTEIMHAFLAKDLTFEGQKLEPTEKITVKHLPLKEVEQMIKAGIIKDAKTIAALLFYVQFEKG